VLHHVVDAGRERLDVGRLDRGEHRDAQLVAAELAVGLGVDDPVARSTFATCAASTESSKSMVPMTCERIAGSCTNGDATGDLSAQPYSTSLDSRVRVTAQSSPPCSFIQSTCSAMRKTVVSAGVL
jgi:hypothetical protein